MGNNSHLTVYKASAGSGKTFRLAVQYIVMLVNNPENYRSILAVTFTNKATAEMKQRIMSQLYGIGHGLKSSQGYFEEVKNSVSLDEQTIRHNAILALDNILQERVNEINDNNKPLTRQQHLARKLYSLVVNNYRKEHQVRFYSEKMCLTPQYLNQIATQIFGKTLSAIITDLLFSTARSMLLSSDITIQEVSDELNFADQSAFSKFIKKICGVSPSKLRKSNPHQEII